MKTIKIIDLLNKIANGEEVPKKIKHHWVYEYKYDELRNEYHYMGYENKRFDEEWLIFSMINDEVEILDEEDEFEDINEFEPTEYADLDNDEKLDYLYDMTRYLIKNQKKIIERLKDGE